MKIVRHAKHLLLHLEQRERHLVFGILRLYPQIPPGHFRLSKSGGTPESQSNQALLDEALAEQRAEAKKQLQRLLSEPKRCEETSSGVRIRFAEGEVDWFLQVLNDIRIGSWLRLGAPEGRVDPTGLKPELVPLFLAMELAGALQMELLGALNRPTI